MLLDEATSSVDIETEDVIRKIINEDFFEATLIIVAHRISTVKNCNRIMVLDSGQVMEYDSPEKLLNNPNSFFSKLIKDVVKKEES